MNNEVKATLLQSPIDYVFNMTALNSGDARRMWRSGIKEAWDHRCAYCGGTPIDDNSLTDLTIDHVRPKSRGGQDRTTNCIPACRRCNQAKGSDEWIAWYKLQDFYTIHGEWRIKEWLRTGQVHCFNEEDSQWLDDIINSTVEPLLLQ